MVKSSVTIRKNKIPFSLGAISRSMVTLSLYNIRKYHLLHHLLLYIPAEHRA